LQINDYPKKKDLEQSIWNTIALYKFFHYLKNVFGTPLRFSNINTSKTIRIHYVFTSDEHTGGQDKRQPISYGPSEDDFENTISFGQIGGLLLER
jgi:hypothetical protein